MTAREEDLARLLQEWADGDEDAFEKLAQAARPELERTARALVRGHECAGARWSAAGPREAERHLSSDALVTRTLLTLEALTPVPAWQGPPHFFAVCARMMRRIQV